MSHVYDTLFYDYIRAGAIRSARALLPLLLAELRLDSVLDVGCGEGAWLSVWRELGIADIQGLDGDYVDRSRLLIPAERFRPHDLSQPFALGRRFALAQCLEVAEHLPEDSGRSLVRSLTDHADLVLFSAAPPGQGGEDHISERPYEYWRALFSERGYAALDPVRPLLAGRLDVEPWYRFNTLLFVRNEVLPGLPDSLRQSALVDGRRVPDVSPPAYRLRKAILGLLPPAWQTPLSRLRYRLLLRGLKRAR
jgi:SAM-dependent methyltransferase